MILTTSNTDNPFYIKTMKLNSDIIIYHHRVSRCRETYYQVRRVDVCLNKLDDVVWAGNDKSVVEYVNFMNDFLDKHETQ